MDERAIQLQIAYWKNGAIEALDTAQDMILRDKRILFGLFFVHLALEKILKARFIAVQKTFPPRIHNLTRLAELSNLALTELQMQNLSAINQFNLEGRYPEVWMQPPSFDEAEHYLKNAQEVFEWLLQTF